MNLDPRGFIIGLLRVLIPTPIQMVMSGFVALSVIVYFDYPLIFARLGLSQEALATAQKQSLTSISGFLGQSWINDTSQLIYWAGVVVLGYVLFWITVNSVVTSRTPVAVEIGATDTAGWISLFYEAGIKVVMGLLLVFYLVGLKAGLSFWVSLTPAVISSADVGSVLIALLGLVGFWLQLYGVIALTQLVITPWYRTVLTD